MNVEAYAEHVARHGPVIEATLRDGRYRPGAVRGVSLAKSGDSGLTGSVDYPDCCGCRIVGKQESSSTRGG